MLEWLAEFATEENKVNESIFNEVKGTNKREQKQIISKIFVGVENNP